MFEIWRTNNGGTSWTRDADANVPVPAASEYGLTNAYTIYGKRVWAGTTDGRVYASADSGKTWTVSSTILAGGSDGLAFRDSLNGMVWGTSSAASFAPALVKTSDGGNTWTQLNLGANVGTTAICTVPKRDAYMSIGLDSASSAGTGVVGNGIVTSVTYNDGASWTILESHAGGTGALPFYMLSVQMLDSTHGWAGNFPDNTLPNGIGGMNKYMGPKILNATSIKSIIEVDNNLVYPNPSNGVINVRLSKALAGTEVSVYDMLGNEIYKTTLNRTIVNQDMNIDISSMQKGMYMLNIKSGTNNQVQKLIIQ
jgi:hypothetical protein